MSAVFAEFGFNLHDAARLLRRDYDRRARRQDISRSRWQILWHLSKHEGTHQAGLAEVLDVAPISLARQLDRLQAEGLVERRTDANDRRCYRLFLMPAAKPVLEQMRTLGMQTRKLALDGFTEPEIEQLIAMLVRVRTNLQSDRTGDAGSHS